MTDTWSFCVKQLGKTISCACWSPNVRRGGCGERAENVKIVAGGGGRSYGSVSMGALLENTFALFSATCEDVVLSVRTSYMK